MAAKPKALTVHVLPVRKSGATLADKVAARKLAASATDIVWPDQTAVYVKGDAGKRLRKQAWIDAMGRVNDVVERIADAIARDADVTVIVGTGRVMEYDPTRGVFANTVAVDKLAEVCEMATTVHISADAQDPRDFV